MDQLEGESWRDTQLRYEHYRLMDISGANLDIAYAKESQTQTHHTFPSGNMMPLFKPTEDDLARIERYLIIGSHLGRAGVPSQPLSRPPEANPSETEGSPSV